MKEQDHGRVGFKKPWKERRENDKHNELGRKAFQVSPRASRYGHISDRKNTSKLTIFEEHYAKAIPLGEKIEVKIKKIIIA